MVYIRMTITQCQGISYIVVDDGTQEHAVQFSRMSEITCKSIRQAISTRLTHHGFPREPRRRICHSIDTQTIAAAITSALLRRTISFVGEFRTVNAIAKLGRGGEQTRRSGKSEAGEQPMEVVGDRPVSVMLHMVPSLPFVACQDLDFARTTTEDDSYWVKKPATAAAGIGGLCLSAELGSLFGPVGGMVGLGAGMAGCVGTWMRLGGTKEVTHFKMRGVRFVEEGRKGRTWKDVEGKWESLVRVG